MPKRSRNRISLPGDRGHTLSSQRPRSFRPSLLLVVVVLLLSANAMFRYTRHRARVQETRVAISQLTDAIQRFRTDVGRCPRTTLEIIHPPRTARRYLTAIPNDGWGRALHVRCPGKLDPNDVDVISAGPSGSLTQDDNIQ